MTPDRGPGICVITAGHLSTCPRMLKAADALHEAGYNVRVVSTRHLDWAWETDQQVYQHRGWKWQVVDYDRESARSTYLKSGLRYKASQFVTRWLGANRLTMGVAARAFGRVYPELLAAALSESADFFYGGTTGGLAVVAAAARRAGKPFALDLEDFHSAEQDDSPESRLAHDLAGRIQRHVLPAARFLTAGSEAIAAAYHEQYDVPVTTVNNTFPLPSEAPKLDVNGDPLKLYWFSQTIGPNRGLEDAVEATKLAKIDAELHLRGRPVPGYLESLQDLVRNTPQVSVVHHSPAEPDAMVDCCRGYDVGLALEQGHVLNRALCLTNKPFTYIHAGLAVAMTDTPGQRGLADDLGCAAIVHRVGDVQALTNGLAHWARDRKALRQAKDAAWQAAQRRWHWEHPLERGALLAAVEQVFQKFTIRTAAA